MTDEHRPGDTLEWRVLTLEQARTAQENRLREVEVRMAGMDEKLTTVVSAVQTIASHGQKIDDGRFNQLLGFILTIIVVIGSAVLQHFLK